MPKTIEEILNETLAPEMKASLKEAFDAKVDAMRVEIEESVRADISNRYEHDKSQLVEAMDKMLTDVIRVHEEAKASEIAQLAEARTKYKTAITESKTAIKGRVAAMSSAAMKMISESVAAEVKSLRDQKVSIANEAAALSESVEAVKSKLVENHEAHLIKINEFVTRQVAKEVGEFAQDKRALVETRVKLISENKQKLAEAQKKFIKEAAAKVEATVTDTLSREMTQLHEDIERNRDNQFGRDIFEAFAATYMSSHLAEGSEVRKLQKMLESRDATIAAKEGEFATMKTKLDEAKTAAATAERRIVVEGERAARSKIISDLVANLRGDKRAVMESMLETTKTVNLKNAFDKLLPVVLAESPRKAVPAGKKVLSETKVAPAAVTTGDRRVRTEAIVEDDSAVSEIARLAGTLRKL
jgi:hypothetical protein